MPLINSRTVIQIMILIISTLFCPSPALTWEFEMTGEFHWTYEWYNQLGSKGFFGPYNIDNGVGTTTSNLNFWNGSSIRYQYYWGGVDARWTYFHVIFEPVLKIIWDQAPSQISHRPYGIPMATDYYTQVSPGIDNAIVEGQWTTFWFTAQTPWGIFAVGKRP